MNIARELLRMCGIIFLTTFMVAFLWQVPYFLAFMLLVPLALSIWFWPHASTGLSYVVGAIMGTLLTAWAIISSVEQPQNLPMAYLWLPLVWGPAGVLVKRSEALIISAWRRRKYDLPEI